MGGSYIAVLEPRRADLDQAIGRLAKQDMRGQDHQRGGHQRGTDGTTALTHAVIIPPEGGRRLRWIHADDGIARTRRAATDA